MKQHDLTYAVYYLKSLKDACITQPGRKSELVERSIFGLVVTLVVVLLIGNFYEWLMSGAES